MAILKCKMCGGDLNIGAGESVGVCEFCGTKQTVPKLDNDRKNNLYDRANHFRRNNEYDKAMAIFENILNEDNTDAESYWSLVLCKYGIEYVKDPVSHKRVPTVNRAQFTSVFADENYKSAIKYADSNQRSIYEAEAKSIDEIQKGILAISQKEKPFDVFICYKETDASGSRTKDSVIANELYHELTKEGFKVFFSRITLEDKLGSAYEPYIFAALNSSKVMVVIGTKAEHLNAVWVKNEWSRYLTLIKNGETKMLIPAYRDMDPYDLPEEFSHLQAQDMSKLGFMQDLIRGIKKITAKDESSVLPVVQKETIVQPASGNLSVEPLLKRVFIFLEDKDFASADEYAEKVLDLDPENPQAYLGKLLADCRIDKFSNLVNYYESFESNNNYRKVCRYGDKELVSQLEGFIKTIKDRNEENRKLSIYNDATDLMNKARTVADFNKAADSFASISGYKDSEALVLKCKELAEETRLKIEYIEAKGRMSRNTETDYQTAIRILEKISAYKDAEELIEKCKVSIEELSKDKFYKHALYLCAGRTVEDQEKAIKCLEELNGYKDSENLIDVCRKRIEEIKEEEIIKREKGRKKAIKTIIGFVVVIGVIIFLMFLFTKIIPDSKYNNAISLMNEGKYSEAEDIFEGLGDYRESEKYLTEIETKLDMRMISNSSIGDYIVLGKYEQDDFLKYETEKIKWQVLDKKDGKILLLSEYALDGKFYNDMYDSVTWESCELRSWLNEGFYNSAFNEYEKKVISVTEVNADKDCLYSATQGNKTEDRVFLLSISELKEYMKNPELESLCYCTATDQANKYLLTYGIDGNKCRWWLRNSGKNNYSAAIVDYEGETYEMAVHGTACGVRPAMWIDISEVD